MSNTILEIILSGIIVPLLGLVIWLIKKWRQQKHYKNLVVEWANKAVGTIKSFNDTIKSSAIKIQPPLKKEIIEIFNELLEQEKEIRKEMC